MLNKAILYRLLDSSVATSMKFRGRGRWREGTEREIRKKKNKRSAIVNDHARWMRHTLLINNKGHPSRYLGSIFHSGGRLSNPASPMRLHSRRGYFAPHREQGVWIGRGWLNIHPAYQRASKLTAARFLCISGVFVCKLTTPCILHRVYVCN